MIPILMLSGLKDEIVPKDEMRTLLEAFAKRGEKITTGGKEYKNGLERTKYIEFPNGGHSKSPAKISPQSVLEDVAHHHPSLDDTCVQEGYWTAVADFVARLSPNY